MPGTFADGSGWVVPASGMTVSVRSFFTRSGMSYRGVASLAHYAAKGADKFRASGAQLIAMVQSQLAQRFFTFRSERQQNFPPVILGARAVHKAVRFETVHEFDRAVMADLHARCELTNSRPHPGRHALDGQHELILAALQTGPLHDFLAEMKKTPDLVPELSQRLIVRQGELPHAADCIVPRCRLINIIS